MTEDGSRDNENIEKKGQQTSALMMKGATILVIAGIVSKIFGAIFRITLTNMIGANGVTKASISSLQPYCVGR